MALTHELSVEPALSFFINIIAAELVTPGVFYCIMILSIGYDHVIKEAYG